VAGTSHLVRWEKLLTASGAGFAACDLARFLDAVFVNDGILIGAMLSHGLISTADINTPIANRGSAIAPEVGNFW
jgi:hypothetical protein